MSTRKRNDSAISSHNIQMKRVTIKLSEELTTVILDRINIFVLVEYQYIKNIMCCRCCDKR